MGYVKWSYDLLHDFCMDVFQKFGFTEKEADIIQDVLLSADLDGIESHGMQRMVRYHKCIQNGMIHIDAKPEVIFETPVTAVIDGHAGMGQLIGHTAMEMAIEKAKNNGVGIVSVRNSNHYGIAGYYARMAVKEGLMGFSCTNSEAIVVPTYGKKAMIGTNPLAFAMPAEPYNFSFDAATSVVTRGKLEMYNKAQKPLPIGWALDENGTDSSDAPRVLSNIVHKAGGGILPLGGSTEQLGSHKGYGYGIVCEIMAAILSQGETSNYCMTGGQGRICHGFMAINPAYFGDPKAIEAGLSKYLQELRDSPKADGQERIYTQGEKEYAAIADRMENGIPVNDNTMVEVKDLCDYLSIDFKSYFKDYQLPEESNKVFHENY
ncbi:MAG: Ldh family oxidoreductase [Lachnospiraceae bacterium]|jgi:L-2-hydroxycarboxylate dehydrogenase (NAD+)|nr:Ldh family oxidoreductase [Lachnospiraceae bacterium]MCI1727445.1 Ldh family oxidoreductase [Lachnospiraceae bacterium]